MALLTHLLTRPALFEPEEPRKYSVEPLAESYRDEVDPRVDWTVAGRRIARMRRRYRRESRFWGEYLRKSERFWKRHARDKGIEAYLWYFEEILSEKEETESRGRIRKEMEDEDNEDEEEIEEDRVKDVESEAVKRDKYAGVRERLHCDVVCVYVRIIYSECQVYCAVCSIGLFPSLRAVIDAQYCR